MHRAAPRHPGADRSASYLPLNADGAIDDTIRQARHYGAVARKNLALFPDNEYKKALSMVIDFCIDRAS